MLRWVLIVVAVLAACVAAAYAAGAALPRTHSVAMEGVVPAPAAAVAARIRDVRAYPDWRPGVAVEDVVERDGAIAFVEIARGDRIAFRLVENTPDRAFVTEITDPGLPFGGAWTFTLTPQGDATRVRIQEDGEIKDPLYRVFARYVFGYAASMQGYLEALGATEIAPVDDAEA